MLLNDTRAEFIMSGTTYNIHDGMLYVYDNSEEKMKLAAVFSIQYFVAIFELY